MGANVRIRRIELRGHPGVGDLSVSFLGEDNTAYDLVVVAGGNGSGKSAILEAIHAAMSGDSGHALGVISLEIDLTPHEIDALRPIHALDGAVVPSRIVTLRYNSHETKNWTEMWQVSWDNEQGEPQTRSLHMYDQRARALFRAMFNEAGVDYQTRTPEAITALALDSTAQTSSRSTGIARQISQLLIDVRAADAEELLAWTKENPGQIPPPDIVEPRFQRFSAAFSKMWPSKRFKRVRRDGNSMFLEFEEFGRISTIDRLSTGEKQIAFRGGYLLRDRDLLAGAIILVDEPELSLHPDWQSRIVSFYREITRQPDGTHPQLIIATHSPFIVHGAPGAKVVILEKNAETGGVSVSPDPTYPISLESRAVEAFSLERFIAAARHQTLVMTEGESDAIILAAAWRKLRPHQPLRFEIRSALGVNNLTNTLNDSELRSKLGDRKLIGLFDFDGDGYNRWNGVWNKTGVVSRDEAAGLTKKHPQLPAWAVLLPVPDFRNADASRSLGPRSLMPIESLFDDANLPAAMREDVVVAGGGQIPQIRNRDKMDFARHTQTLAAASFAAFEPLMQIIEDVLIG